MTRAGWIALAFSLSLSLAACATGPGVSPRAREEGAALWAQGKGLLLKVEKELGLDQPVSERGVGMGMLTSQQFADLTKARLDLRDAVMQDPGAPWAPEAMFLAARTLDYGLLQQFPRAIEEYLDVAARFPETIEGKTAAARALLLKERFSNSP